MVDSSLSLRACGCGVKIDLDQIVYPLLHSLNSKNQNTLTDNVIKRRDCFFVKKNIASLTRKIFTSDMTQFHAQILELCQSKKPALVVELYSSSFNFYREFDQLKDQFNQRQAEKFEILFKVKNEMQKSNPGYNLEVAKGHSIQGEADFIVLDFIELGEDSKNDFLMNNDTIITGDSVLEAHSPVSIFIAINNSLNDLLIYGGFEDINIYPVYDGNPEQVKHFKNGFRLYQDFLKERGVTVTIQDQGPLNVGSHLIGATVTSRTKREAPGFGKVLPGQKILLTHFLGDLALLSIHRAQFLKDTIDPKIALERIEVLQKLTSPHYLMSKIVSEFLPESGEIFNEKKHITFISDVSGPGLSVLEDAAETSGVDLKIHTLNFNNEDILNFSRKNYTTSTNGPWLIIGNEVVLNELHAKLHAAGFAEAHFIGEVLQKNKNPKIYVDKKLAENFSTPNFKHNLLSPQITVKNHQQNMVIDCPLFQNMELI